MIYIRCCKDRFNLTTEGKIEMGSLEDFDISAVLQKLIAFVDSFSSDSPETVE